MGFQSSDAIITKGLEDNVDIYGSYTLLISVIVYFVIIRSVLLELFSTVPLIIRRVIRRIEDGTQNDIIPPVTYIMPYFYLPLNRRYESPLILKLWTTFKVLTSIFFVGCPVLLLGYTVARAFGVFGIDQNYHFMTKWSSIISLTTELTISFIVVLGGFMFLIYFIANSAAKSKTRSDHA